jgi:hypothetical protein
MSMTIWTTATWLRRELRRLVTEVRSHKMTATEAIRVVDLFDATDTGRDVRRVMEEARAELRMYVQ